MHKKEFGDLVLENRNKKKLTQKALADLVGLSSAAINAYELKDSRPSFINAMKVSEVLEFNIDVLLKGRHKTIKSKGGTFGERLKYLRERTGMTKDELGQAIGKSRFMIHKYEENIVVPNLLIVIQLADFFKVSLYSFIKAK